MNRPVPPPLTREPGAPLARPFDAATLIIYRATPKRLEVLMGERHAKHKFMPNRYVFPGGRVDSNDSRVRVASPLRVFPRNVAARPTGVMPGFVRSTIPTGIPTGRSFHRTRHARSRTGSIQSLASDAVGARRTEASPARPSPSRSAVPGSGMIGMAFIMSFGIAKFAAGPVTSYRMLTTREPTSPIVRRQPT